MNATQAVAMLLYVLGHNTRFRCIADRFQHSTETVCRHFHQALRAVHHYTKHLIKPDQNVTGIPEHLQVNKYWPPTGTGHQQVLYIYVTLTEVILSSTSK